MLAAFAVALLALTGVSYVPASENWVCGTVVDPRHILLFDFDIVGSQVVENGKMKGVNLRFPVLRNDDHSIIFKWHEDTPTTPQHTKDTLAVIDKSMGGEFKIYDMAEIADNGRVEGLISAQGSCQRFER